MRRKVMAVASLAVMTNQMMTCLEQKIPKPRQSQNQKPQHLLVAWLRRWHRLRRKRQCSGVKATQALWVVGIVTTMSQNRPKRSAGGGLFGSDSEGEEKTKSVAKPTKASGGGL